jgi:hypothetical protein
MFLSIQVVGPRPLPWRGKALKLPVPMGSGGGGGGTRTVPAVLLVWPPLGQGRLLAWRLSHVFVRATFGPPPPPPTFILAFAMANNPQINLAMAAPKILFLSMTSTNTLNLVMHGS